MMMIINIITPLQAIAATVAAAMTWNSVYNMYQTYQLVHDHPKQQYHHYNIRLPTTLDDIKQMKRHEIVELYLYYCNNHDDDYLSSSNNNMMINKMDHEQDEQQRILLTSSSSSIQTKKESTSTITVSSSSLLEGEWNGMLLNNNGLTFVSYFLSNQLFGKGHLWNGKRFHNKVTSKHGGINRFINSNSKINNMIIKEENHKFDWNIESSQIQSNKSSIILRYHNYQPFFSLWKTMIDEIRILPTTATIPIPITTTTTTTTTTSMVSTTSPSLSSNNDDIDNNNYTSKTNLLSSYDIIIGLGCMAWSGGMYNAAPFCLYRLKQQQQ